MNSEFDFFAVNPLLEKASERPNLFYHTPTNKYIELRNDGTVIVLTCDLCSVQDGREYSVAGGYKRMLNGESRLLMAFNDYDGVHITEIDDLNALADGFGIPRTFEHEHRFTYTLANDCYSERGQVKVDIKFNCGCSLGECNCRGFARYFKEKHGWDLVLKSAPMLRSNECRIRLKRNTFESNPL